MNVLKIYVNKNFAIYDIKNTIFVMGDSNVDYINIFLDSDAEEIEYVTISFERADGITILDLAMTKIEDYWNLTIGEELRILDVPGPLKIGFKMSKTIQQNGESLLKTYASPEIATEVHGAIMRPSAEDEAIIRCRILGEALLAMQSTITKIERYGGVYVGPTAPPEDGYCKIWIDTSGDSIPTSVATPVNQDIILDLSETSVEEINPENAAGMNILMVDDDDDRPIPILHVS